MEATKNIWQLLIYKFKLEHNPAEATKNICWAKSEGAIDNSTVRWFKKFCLGCKNFDDQAMAGRSKTRKSKAALQAIETNLQSSTLRVSGNLSILQSRVVYHLHLGKNV